MDSIKFALIASIAIWDKKRETSRLGKRKPLFHKPFLSNEL